MSFVILMDFHSIASSKFLYNNVELARAETLALCHTMRNLFIDSNLLLNTTVD